MNCKQYSFWSKFLSCNAVMRLSQVSINLAVYQAIRLRLCRNRNCCRNVCLGLPTQYVCFVGSSSDRNKVQFVSVHLLVCMPGPSCLSSSLIPGMQSGNEAVYVRNWTACFLLLRSLQLKNGVSD